MVMIIPFWHLPLEKILKLPLRYSLKMRRIGSTAAPIASLMIEQYLKGDVERVELEKEMIDKVFYKVE